MTADERKMVTVTVSGDIDAITDGGDYCSKFIATDMLEWLASMVPSIPQECRASARVDISAYADQCGHVEIDGAKLEYQRPETDEEMAARLARDEDYLRQQEAREKREYERLAAKFAK